LKDLTQGPVSGHLLAMAAPLAVGLLVQTLYYVVDLYFVGRLGDTALAGVGAAGNFTFVIIALTQVLGVGTVSVLAHAVGAKDRPTASLAFNQSLVLAAVCAALALFAGLVLSEPYMRAVAADDATAAAGTSYLRAFAPGLALQFALAAMGSALRGTGVAKPTMVVQLATVLVNAALAPVLIAGIGTGVPLGVAGAGLASSIAVAFGVVLMTVYFLRLEHYVGFRREEWRPVPSMWRRILGIGLPSGGEFALMFVFVSTIYYAIQSFGPAAQAGFGVGARVQQMVLLPAMALAFAVAPVAGQNFGAKLADRVRETFRRAAWMIAGVMLVLTLLVWWRAASMIGFFSTDPHVVEVGATFLRITSLNFVASGLIFTCSGVFQGLGRTWPSIAASGTRLVTYVGPALWLSHRPDFRLEHLWWLSVATVGAQLVVALWLLQVQLRERLAFSDAEGAASDAGGAAPGPAAAAAERI
jgi:putative MATE family efflux protein